MNWIWRGCDLIVQARAEQTECTELKWNEVYEGVILLFKFGSVQFISFAPFAPYFYFSSWAAFPLGGVLSLAPRIQLQRLCNVANAFMHTFGPQSASYGNILLVYVQYQWLFLCWLFCQVKNLPTFEGRALNPVNFLSIKYGLDSAIRAIFHEYSLFANIVHSADNRRATQVRPMSARLSASSSRVTSPSLQALPWRRWMKRLNVGRLLLPGCAVTSSRWVGSRSWTGRDGAADGWTECCDSGPCTAATTRYNATYVTTASALAFWPLRQLRRLRTLRVLRRMKTTLDLFSKKPTSMSTKSAYFFEVTVLFWRTREELR